MSEGSGTPGGLFGPIFAPDRLREAVSDRAWLGAMLKAEAALAAALAGSGLIPEKDADAIRACCKVELFDADELGRAGRAAGNPVVPLVEKLAAAVPGHAARQVHRGATSQDIMGTAAMLVASHCMDLILPELTALAAGCARLAEEHSGTLVAGRTLMQQALPVTFGLKAAGWLVSVVEAWQGLRHVRRHGLAAQLGGATGTLASLEAAGPTVLSGFANELGLTEPVVPWHASRGRVAQLAGALVVCAGVAGKIAGDVILMAQTEVGEVAEPASGGRGGSSTLPHKRNPILSVTAAAGARKAKSSAHDLQSAMDHERAAGAWHAEWQALAGALCATGGAVAAVREMIDGLGVHPNRMRENLDATGGLILAENITTVLTEVRGRLEAHEMVQAACERAVQSGTALKQELMSEPAVSRVVSGEEIEAALDPSGYLGSSRTFVDRALSIYEKETRDRVGTRHE